MKSNAIKIIIKLVLSLVLIGLIITPIIVWVHSFHSLGISNDPKDWTEFATYVAGTVGCIVTLLGFIFIYLTYQEQIQNNYISGFESTFFKMIEFHFQIIDGISTSNNDKGKSALNHYCFLLTKYCMNEFTNTPQDKNYFTNITTSIQTNYPTVYGRTFYRIGHYYRHLYHIFKFINESNLNEDDKQKYAKILRSQLSSEEIILIGINGMTNYGEKFKELIEKYSLLHRLLNFDTYRALFISYYNVKAFGDEEIYSSLPKDINNEYLYNILVDAKKS